MRNLKLFLDLIRFKQPIGFMLLFWPCLWGLTLSNNFSGTNHLYFKHIVLFFFGSILIKGICKTLPVAVQIGKKGQ